MHRILVGFADGGVCRRVMHRIRVGFAESGACLTLICKQIKVNYNKTLAKR